MCDDVALQTFLGRMAVLCLKVKSLDASLTLGALLPLGLRTLVATDVDILRREELCDFLQHIVNECKGLVVAGAEHVVRHAPLLPHLVRTAGASHVWVSGKSSLHVAGQINLRNDGNIAVCGILDDVANLLLGVETAVRLAVILA